MMVQEMELLIRLLSFGPVVKLLSPASLAEKLRERVMKPVRMALALTVPNRDRIIARARHRDRILRCFIVYLLLIVCKFGGSSKDCSSENAVNHAVIRELYISPSKLL